MSQEDLIVSKENIINKYVFGFFILAFAILLFLGIKDFLRAFLGAIVFYILFKNLMYRLIHKRNWPKWLAAIFIIIISFFIIVLPIGTIVGLVYNKIALVVGDPEQLNNMLSQISAELRHTPLNISAKDLEEKIVEFGGNHVGSTLTAALGALTSLIMMYFFLYFLLINTRSLEAKIIFFLPYKKSKILLFGKELVDQTYSNAIGVPTVAIAQGILAYVCYYITDVPEAGIWAVLTGCASVIPIVGTAIIWIPVSIFCFAYGQTWQGIFVLLFCATVLGSIDNIIRMVVSKRIGDVHPVITVLGIILGLKFFGLVGLVFGPLVFSYFLLLLRLYNSEYIQNKNVDVFAPVTPSEDNLVKLLIKKIASSITSPLPAIKKQNNENLK